MRKEHTNQLVKMVNHISVHSASLGDVDVCGAFVAAHINSFWALEMKRQLVEHAAENRAAFSAISTAAIAVLIAA